MPFLQVKHTSEPQSFLYSSQQSFGRERSLLSATPQIYFTCAQSFTAAKCSFSVEKNDANDQGGFSAFSCSEPGYFFFFFNFIYLFIYLWLCWVFVSVRGLSLVVASGGHSSSRCTGLSLSRPLPLQSTGSRRAGSVVVAHGPSYSAACGIFPDQGSNPCPLH